MPFPDLVSFNSQLTILPSTVTLPSFAVISFIFIFFSFAFDGFPIIYSCGLLYSSTTKSLNSCSPTGIYPSKSVGIL